jgi:aryl-alcohol dehydrogenase-like predicted oxidoreductase
MRGSNRVSDTVRAGWAKSTELLQFAYDNGVRFFDCADLYGTHQIVADAMKGKPRDSYTVVSKIWLHPGGLPEKERLAPEETIARFLRELRTDYSDILQIHCMMNDNWKEQFADAMEGLEKLKQQGKIRAHGISSHSFAATRLAAQTAWCDTVHIRINSEGMNMDGPKDDAEARVKEGVEVARKTHSAGKGIIAMKVLGEGKMSDKPDLRKKSAAFVANLDCVDVMIVGFSEKEHITEFIENVKNA